jgi:putative tryptophan/tyrosine transport system substrate-binding protein
VKRREFITLIGGGAAAWPVVARGQQLAVPVIGFMSSRSAIDSEKGVKAFVEGLADNGFTAGKNVEIKYVWANGDYDQLKVFAQSLVKEKVAVIVAVGGVPSAAAAKRATSIIPIVFSVGPDPVKAGLVGSFNRPEANVTGVSLLTNALETKRLGLIHELVPTASTIAALMNPANPASEQQAQEITDAARSMNQRVEILRASDGAELARAFAKIKQIQATAMLVGADPFFDTRRDEIIRFAREQRLPAIYQFRDYAVAGGLASYGISLTDSYQQVGAYAARILKGTRPQELPILQPTKFELVINLKTAKALDLTVPPSLLARADEVIE